MRKKLNLIVAFYVLYFTWLFLLAYLWPSTSILAYFLIGIVVFYLIFLRESADLLMFLFVVFASYLIFRQLAFDPGFAQIGFPKLGIPYWPIAWGITALAIRKFYLIISKGPKNFA